MTLQYRIAPEGEVRDVDDGKRQALISIPWEVIDTYNTDFARDCFDESLRQRLPAMCWQHQLSEPIGRAINWQKGSRANEFIAQFSDFDAVPRSRQAFAQLRDKEITDFSFGFDQVQAQPHPSVRGGVRFTRARMPELSPVTVGAIPGAVGIAIRAEAEIANVRGLVDVGMISAEDGMRMLREAGVTPPDVPALPREIITVGNRATTITIAADGTVSVDGEPANPAEPNDETDPNMLALAVDSSLDAACDIFDTHDLTTLPPNIQQAVALVTAASVAVDELLDVLGVPDPDDGSDTMPGLAVRATVSDTPWSQFAESDYTGEQWQRACLIVLNNGKTKDDSKLPVREPDGTLNRNGVHAAAAALAGTRGVAAPMSAKVAAARTLTSIYEQLNEQPPTSLTSLAGGKRSADDIEAADALLTLDRIITRR